MWFIYSLVFALLTSFGVIIAKRVMQDGDEYSFLWISNLLTLPFLLAIILFFYQLPKIDTTFIWATAASALVNVVAAVLAYRAIKISEVSLINPISAFNPVFTAFISFFTLGERIRIRGGVGIILVILGAYLLQIKKLQGNFLKPIRAIISHKGVQMSLVAYFLWAITPSLQKTAIFHTSPQVPAFASFVGTIGCWLLYTPTIIKLKRKPFLLLKKHFKLLILSGFIGGIGQAVAFAAFSLAGLGPVTAIFKLSMLFTVILGWLFFKEKDIKERFLGAAIMLGGVFLLIS